MSSLAVDTTPPTVSCPGDINETAQVGTSSAEIFFDDANATDNSGTVTLASQSHTSGSSFNIGMTTVTFTYEDGNGNTGNCSFLITISEGKFLFLVKAIHQF